MPELPEVQTVVASLRPRVTGRVVSGVTVSRNDILSPKGIDLIRLLIQRRIEAVDRRAKRVVFTLDDGNRFYIHLGMSGLLTVDPPAADVRGHTHLVVELRKREEVFQLRFREPRRFGGLFWMGRDGGEENLGPEPLNLSPRRLARLLAGTRRAIKAALLDQR